MANLWELHEELAEGGPSKANSNDSLFGEEIIDDKEPELSTSFYVEQNLAEQAPPLPFQPFSLEEFRLLSPLDLPVNPVGPIMMMSYMNLAPQNSAHAKEYGLNKPMPQGIPTRMPCLHQYEQRDLYNGQAKDRLCPVSYE